MTDAPLDGIVVADFSRVLAGPLSTMVLADLGATVIKVEHPAGGDDTRVWGPPFVGDDAAYFLAVNRNKRSLTLDLTDPDDVQLARRLIARSDVLVENFRPGVMERFGLGYEDLCATNPALVYCSVIAFLSDEAPGDAGYDLLMQALSGFMSITGERDRGPVKIGSAILDVVAGLYLTVGLLAALRDRDRTGVGRHVEVGLFDASISALANQAGNVLLGDLVPTALGTEHPSIVPYQVFPAADGGLALAAGNDKLFRRTCVALGRGDLADDPDYVDNAHRVANRGRLVAALSAVFATRPVSHWVDALSAAGVPAAPVRTLDQVFESPEGRSTVVTVDDDDRGELRLVRSPWRGIGLGEDQHRAPPRLGEHTDDVRAWLATEGDP